MAALLTYRSSFGNGSGNIDIGPASGTRLVIICVAHYRSSSPGRTITGGTVGGAAATIADQIGAIAGSPIGVGILYRETTGGGTTAMTVTLSGSAVVHTDYVYTLENYASATPFDTAHASGNDPSVAIDFPAGGGVVGLAATVASAGGITWSGLAIEDNELGFGDGRSSIAHTSNATAGTNVAVSFSSASTIEALSVVSWAAATPPPTGRAKVWSGSAWALKPVKVWSGSAWVEKPLKVWNGSAWV
jgi:hypothetical protein